MENGHSKSVDEVLNHFGTDLDRGLSSDQVKSNQLKYGPNGKLTFYCIPFFIVYWQRCIYFFFGLITNFEFTS